ncbi:JmjC domain-containing protein 7, partial [Rhizoclosmatium sp. JEL0117]
MTTDPKEVLRIHSQTFRSFGGHTLASFEGSPSPLAFAKLVAENRPALFRNSNVEDWPAMESFGNRSQLVDLIGSDRNVKVAVTPNGLADAVIDGTFVLPHEESMPIEEFFDRLDAEDPSNPQAVHYIQSQNNNMRGDGDFAKLFEQVPEHIDFATEALGAMPDAVNFWCGSRHAVTSFHKDHYENIYIVITGSKTFTLIPPSESWALEERTFPTSKYTPTETGSWTQEEVYMDPKTYDTTTDASQSHP